MRTAKRTGIAALFAVFFALLLAGCLCLGLPAKREAQAAEAEIVDKENAVASVVASDGTTTYYKALRAALSSAESGETVNVLKNTSDAVEGKIGALGGYDVWLQVANKSIDIVGVGENRTLTATDCDWALYVVSSGTAQYTLTVENLNIVCSGTARWPMEVANGNYEVTLNNVTLNNENAVSSEAGFTVGGVGSNTTVTIKNSEIITGDNGKAIRVLNPVKLTVDNSHLKGRAALYMQGAIKGSKGSAGSEVSVENGSVLESYAAAAYSSGREEFGTLVFEMSGVKVTVKDSEIVATAADGAQAQGVVFYSDYSIGDGNKLSEISVNFENTDITVTGNVKITYGAGDDSAEGGASPTKEEVIVEGGAFNFEVPEGYLAAGMAVYEVDGKYLVGDQNAVAFVMETSKGYTSLQDAIDAAGEGATVTLLKDVTESVTIEKGKNITLDLNGQRLTNKEGSHTITNYGTLTITDSGENGTVDNESHGRGALVNYGMATLSGGTFTRSKEAGTYTPNYNGNGNSYYTVENFGILTVDGATVTTRLWDGEKAVGGYSSLIRSTNDEAAVTDVPSVIIKSGKLTGGANTVKIDAGTLKIEGGELVNSAQNVVMTYGTETVIESGTLTLENPVRNDGGDCVVIYASSDTAGTEGSGTVTVNGGTLKVVGKAANAVISGVRAVANADVTINSVEFKAENNGSFDNEVLAEGSAQVSVSAAAGVDAPAGAVASVETDGRIAYFTSLQDAINAAEDGDTVKLLENVDTASTITIAKSLTLDLNGKKITAASGATVTISGGKTAETGITVNIKNGYINSTAGDGVLIGNAATVNMNNVEVVGYNYGIMLNEPMDEDTAKTYVQPTTLTMEGGKAVGTNWAGVAVCGINNDGGEATKFTATGATLTGGWYGVAGHGTSHNTYISLTNCTVTGTKGDPEGTTEAAYKGMGLGIYHPQKGELIIDGGTITGVASGIEMRSGSLTVKGDAKITALSKTANMTPNGSGSTAAGMAIAVSQHTTNNPISVTLENGTFTGVYALFERDIQDPSTGTVAMKVTGGTFNGDIASENVKNFIEGGDFNTVFPRAYLAENAVLVKTADGFKALGADSEDAKAYVAEVSDPDAETAVRYQTLADAITAAGDGDTVKLLKNIGEESAWRSSDGSGNLQFYATDGREVTLDFGGHTVYSGATTYLAAFGGTLKLTNGSLYVYGTGIQITANLPSIESKVILTNSFRIESYNQSVVFMTTNGNTNEKNLVAVLESAANLISWNTNNDTSQECWATIQGNGTQHGTKINITGGSVVNKKDVAIYHPQYGELTISGGEVYGETTGIEIRAGKLTVKGGKITGNGNPFTADPNGNGSTTVGAAVAVSQHSTNFELNATITGGELIGARALFEIDLQDENVSGISLNVESGTFKGEVISENVTGFIEGGAFSEMPKMDYFAENYIAEYKAETGMYETKEGSWVADIGEEGYATLQDAINAAENGETIILRADIGSAETPEMAEEIVVDKAGAKITLDLKGKSIYVTNDSNDVNTGLKFINLKAGTLNVINSEEEGGVISASGRAFQIVPEKKVEAKLVLGEGVKVHAVGGPAVFIKPDGEANVSDGAYYAVLESAADLSTDSTYGAIQGNGTKHGTFITINGGTLSSQGNVIYHPQYGKLVINGGTFGSPVAGVEVRAGELIVNGGTFNIGGTFKCEYNGNGATIEGAAIAISQHTTNLPLEFTIAGGTFNSDADGKAFYQAATVSENTAPVTGEIKGGEFNGEVGAATLTGFIEGGDFGVKPADELMNEGYAAEYVNGRYVAVPSTALKEARLAAQADVRAYAATMGFAWSDIVAAAEDESAVEAQLVLTTYKAIAEAMSTLAVAEAKDEAFDAVDDYAAATGADAKLVAEAIKEIETAAAASEDQTAVVVPTATYAAIYAAETKAELKYLKDNALAEIADIRAYRGEIAAQAKELETLAAAIAAIDGDLFGTEEGAQGAIQDIQDAIKAAQNAITGGNETTSTSLKEIYEYLEGTLKGAVDGIREMLNEAVSEGGILYKMQATLEALNATVNGDGTEGSALLDQLTAAITDAQNAINNNTATEMGEAVEKITAAITAAQGVIIAALPDYKETLGEIAGSVDKLEELLGGTNGLVAIKEGIDDALAAIGTADGETLFGQLAAIESGNTAIKTTVDELAAALTGTDGAIATLTAALTAMQGDITELTGALAEDTGWVAKDITAAQAEIDKLTAAVGKLGTVDGKDLAAVVGEIADGLEEMDATVNSIASTVSAASAVEEAKTQAAADIRTWLEGYLEELAGDTAQADVLARAAYTAETTEGELYKDISAQFGEENGKLVLKYYNEALAAIDAATTVSDVTTAVATFRAQVASIEASAGNSTDLTVVYVLLGVVLLVLIIACIVALVKGGRKPEPAPAQAAPAEKPAEAQPEEKAEEKEEQAEEAAPAEEPAGETAPAEEESAAAEDDDKERVVISANVRTFDEAYEDLTDEQRELFNKVKEYALAKEDAVEVKQSGGVVIKRKSKQIVKLTVRRDMPVALFLLENEMLKDFRRNAKSEAKLKVRATELVIREADDLETAYTMVDLSVEQIEKDLEAAKERRREARRQRRLQRQAEEAAAEQAEGAGEPAPAEEPASAESAATDGTDTE